MENDILDSLQDLGYEGPLTDETLFEKSVELGTGSVEYTQLVEWTTQELSGFSGIEDHVNSISSVEDSETFLMELSGFLREFGCPYPSLCEGPITERLEKRSQRLHLLDYLLTELQAARMTAVNKPQLNSTAMEVEEAAESDTAKQMKLMLMALSFPKPPDGITPFQLFSKVETKVKEILANVQAAHLSKPLLKARLSDKQWDSVEFINKALQQEYECRREMIVKRLDVTIQSFKWSDKAKHKEDKIATVLQPVRHKMLTTSRTQIPHLLAAREDLLKIEKTSSGAARDRTKCDINRVTIGKVPDRGGRALEHEIPPPEMPAFQQRQAQPQRPQGSGRGGGDRGGRGRGGGGGDRGRGTQRQDSWGSSGGASGGGGWSQGQNQNYNNPQNQNTASAFFGGQPGSYHQQATNYQQSGYQQQAGYQQPHGGYQQSHGGYQQGGHQQGGHQQGGHQQGGHQQQSEYQRGSGRGGRRGGGRGGRR